MLMLAPLPFIPRVFAVVLATFATLAHGIPSELPFTDSGISLAPYTHRKLVLTLAVSVVLITSRADDQQLLHLPCVTIHVYDPTDQFNTVHTANHAHSGFESDQSHLVYGDSDSEAALFRSIYGTEHHESDSGGRSTAHTQHNLAMDPRPILAILRRDLATTSLILARLPLATPPHAHRFYTDFLPRYETTLTRSLMALLSLVANRRTELKLNLSRLLTSVTLRQRAPATYSSMMGILAPVTMLATVAVI
jgi:hypothetical protein